MSTRFLNDPFTYIHDNHSVDNTDFQNNSEYHQRGHYRELSTRNYKQCEVIHYRYTRFFDIFASSVRKNFFVAYPTPLRDISIGKNPIEGSIRRVGYHMKKIS